MPKKYFWPASMVSMGLIVLASNMGLLPYEFRQLWPLILIVCGLGGLLVADRDEWLVDVKSTRTAARKTAPAAKRRR